MVCFWPKEHGRWYLIFPNHNFVFLIYYLSFTSFGGYKKYYFLVLGVLSNFPYVIYSNASTLKWKSLARIPSRQELQAVLPSGGRPPPNKRNRKAMAEARAILQNRWPSITLLMMKRTSQFLPHRPFPLIGRRRKRRKKNNRRRKALRLPVELLDLKQRWKRWRGLIILKYNNLNFLYLFFNVFLFILAKRLRSGSNVQALKKTTEKAKMPPASDTSEESNGATSSGNRSSSVKAAAISSRRSSKESTVPKSSPAPRGRGRPPSAGRGRPKGTRSMVISVFSLKNEKRVLPLAKLNFRH